MSTHRRCDRCCKEITDILSMWGEVEITLHNECETRHWDLCEPCMQGVTERLIRVPA